MQGQKDHGKWGVTIPSESSQVSQTMRRLQHSPEGNGTLAEPLSKKETGVKVPHLDASATSVLPAPPTGCRDTCLPCPPHAKHIQDPAGRMLGHAQVLCIADINRAGSQAVRGGGAMCFVKNVALWEAFNEVITGEEPCQM